MGGGGPAAGGGPAGPAPAGAAEEEDPRGGAYLGRMLSLNQGLSPPPFSYPEVIRHVKPESKYELRLRVVQAARQIGVKPTAKLYGTSPQTVRKWVRRYQAQQRRGLGDR